MGKSQISKGEPMKHSTTFLSHSPYHLILPKMVELVNAWGWGRVWQSETRIEEVIIFWKKKF